MTDTTDKARILQLEINNSDLEYRMSQLEAALENLEQRISALEERAGNVIDFTDWSQQLELGL